MKLMSDIQAALLTYASYAHTLNKIGPFCASIQVYPVLTLEHTTAPSCCMLKCYTWILAQKSQSDTRKTTKWILRSVQGLLHLKITFIRFLLQMMIIAENCSIVFTQCIMPCAITQSRAVVCSSVSTGYTGMLAQNGPILFKVCAYDA